MTNRTGCVVIIDNSAVTYRQQLQIFIMEPNPSVPHFAFPNDNRECDLSVRPWLPPQPFIGPDRGLTVQINTCPHKEATTLRVREEDIDGKEEED